MSYRLNESEKKLLTEILKGDQRALWQFYKTYVPRISLFIKRKIQNSKDAEETLQDSLFAFLEALRDFNGGCSLYTFIYAIAKRKVVDYYRRQKIKKVLFSQLPAFENLILQLETPEEEFDKKQIRVKIRRTFDMIRPLYKKILIMKYLDNLSVKQIAKQLSVSFKSAESTLFRARKSFAKVYSSV